MAIASMTGFAREAGATGPYQWAWEIKTVNGRGLEIRLRTPPGFDAVAEEARGLVQKTLARGQCQLSLSVTRAAASPRIAVNQDILQALVSALSAVELPAGIKPASLDGLLSVRGVVEIDESGDPAADQALMDALRSAVPRLVEAVADARREEGRALTDIIEAQLETISELVGKADNSPARQPEAIRARLEAQIELLMQGKATLDPARLHQEAVLIAARADIREELDRLRAHVESARRLLHDGGAVGRRLDFLAQEFGREANTLCSKANDVSLSRIGLDLKAVIEQFREQVQNVE